MNAKDVESEILYGDFGRDVAQTVKLQIELLLNYVVKSVKNKEERRNRYLFPLKYLLCYVKNSGLQDILKMDADQEAEIALMLRKQMGESNVNATKFIAFCRKTLFLEAKEINWEANVWYVEKLNISPERYSLSSTIDSFSFLDIRREDNRKMLQEYLKYLFVVANLNLGTVRIKQTYIKEFCCCPFFLLKIVLIACHRINRYNDMRIEKGKGFRTLIFCRELNPETIIKNMLLYQSMKWNTRKMGIFLITSKEESVCPCCGSPLKYRDSRRRVQRKAGGGKEWCLIRRLRCSNDRCRRLHNELPDCMCPCKHYGAGLIEDVVDGVVGEEDIETEDYPCCGTMKHWRWWSQMNEKNMEGQIRQAAHRFLDLDGKFLKSRDPLLEKLKERISPGWLKAAVRAVYNSGGRIEPYPGPA